MITRLSKKAQVAHRTSFSWPLSVVCGRCLSTKVSPQIVSGHPGHAGSPGLFLRVEMGRPDGAAVSGFPAPAARVPGLRFSIGLLAPGEDGYIVAVVSLGNPALDLNLSQGWSTLLFTESRPHAGISAAVFLETFRKLSGGRVVSP